MRLTTEVFHSVQTRRRRGSSSVTPVTDDRFFMDFYSTANNKFYPLYIIHDLYARTKKEIIYRVPWVNTMPNTSGRWADVGTALQKSAVMQHVIINGRVTPYAVCKGFVCHVQENGNITPLVLVATPYVDELFTIGKKKTINQKNFYILQTKAFIEDVQYRNLRSQLRKIYIKPLIDSGLNVIITHDMNELSFTPIKLQMKFGSIDEMDETIDILKKEICPKPTPVKLEDSSKHEEIRERIENSWDELMRESTLRTMPSDETSFFGVGDAPITTTSTSDYSGGMSPDGTPVDGTLQYLENDRVRQFNGATGTWVELAATNTDSLPSSGTPVTTNEEEVQRILQDLRTTGEPVNRDIDHQFIDRIMGVTTPQEEDDDEPAF